MIMHKTSAYWEAGAKPTPELIQRVGGMVGEIIAAGILLAGDGLAPSSQGARVTLKQGEPAVIPGPFSGEGALPARYAIFRAGTVEDAADLAARFGRIFGDVVVDVRPVNEAWDLGFAPKPEGLTTRRYMAVVNANAASEAGGPLSAEQKTALKGFTEDLTRTGAFIACEHFEPSRAGKRLRQAPGATPSTPAAKPKRVIMDGPFTESKELIGGFVTVEVQTLEDAVGWALKYVEAVDVEEVDVRALAEIPR